MPADASLHVAVQRLHATYADVVTRRAWPELSPLFAPDARVTVQTVTRPSVELVGVAQLAEFVDTALARFAFFELVPLNAVAELTGDGAARGRLWMVELRQDRESGSWSEAYGRYDDRYVVRDGAWCYAERSYRSLARRSGLPGAEVLTPAEEL